MDKIVSLYTDGGCLTHNPSHVGGTWAWCGVDKNNKRVIERGGYILAPDNGSITNNHMEQIAIVLALEAMSEGWAGKIFSDSRIALYRVFRNWRTFNLPDDIIERTSKALSRLGYISHGLLQGHPTKQDLKNGIGKRRGLPVSPHNVWCDEECNRQKDLYFQQLKEKELSGHVFRDIGAQKRQNNQIN